MNNGFAEEGEGELVVPPVEVIAEMFDGVVRHERTTGANAKHGFQ